MEWLYDWVQAEPPAPILWFTIFASLAGVVALATVPEAIWGSPRITFQWSVRTDFEGAKVLACSIVNMPEHRRLLRRWVRREAAEDVVATVRVSEAGTQRVIASVVTFYRGDGADQRFRVPASLVGARGGIVSRSLDDGEAVILDGAGTHTPIVEGEYYCRIRVIHGSHVVDGAKGFIIHRKPQDIFWT